MRLKFSFQQSGKGIKVLKKIKQFHPKFFGCRYIEKCRIHFCNLPKKGVRPPNDLFPDITSYNPTQFDAWYLILKTSVYIYPVNQLHFEINI